MTVELAQNDERYKAALEAQSKIKCNGDCKKEKAKPVKRHVRKLQWDELQYRRGRQFMIGMIKFGVLRMLSAWAVKRMLWAFDWSWRAWEFLRTVTSGTVDELKYRDRMTACLNCDILQVTKKGQNYCGGCNCPKWYLSRLTIKNHFKRDHCPKGLHGDK
jgi:hypothetical protein